MSDSNDRQSGFRSQIPTSEELDAALPTREELDEWERVRTEAHIAQAIAPLLARIDALEREVSALKQ